MFIRIISLLILMAFFQPTMSSQETGPPKQTFRSKMKQRKADRKQWREDRRNQRAEKKAIRAHHKRIQTKAVRKRMKSKKKVALRNQNNEREPFFQRLFKKKGIRRAKKTKERGTTIKQ